MVMIKLGNRTIGLGNYQVSFRFTNKCNLECAHCLRSCGPRGETIGNENLEKVLGHMPPQATALLITGGEPLVERKKLEHMLDYIKSEKQRIMPYADVAVNTNGFWLRNAEEAYETIRRLYDRGVSGISITSNDRFHRAQGLDISRFAEGEKNNLQKAIGRLAKETKSSLTDYEKQEFKGYKLFNSKKEMRFLVAGVRGGVLPFGRAKELPKFELGSESSCGARYFPRTITIETDGEVYPTGCIITPSLGSAIEKPVEQIVEKALAKPWMRKLYVDGVAGVARLLGTYNPKDEGEYEKNPCSKCEEIFRGMR